MRCRSPCRLIACVAVNLHGAGPLTDRLGARQCRRGAAWRVRWRALDVYARKPGACGRAGLCGVWRDYSTRQARTPPASFFVAVFHFFTCRAHEHHATAAGRSGKRNESPGTISRSSGVIRFVTVLRGGGGMFFVIMGRAYTVPLPRRQWLNLFLLWHGLCFQHSACQLGAQSCFVLIFFFFFFVARRPVICILPLVQQCNPHGWHNSKPTHPDK